MSKLIQLDLRTLPQRHPLTGLALLNYYGPAAVVRFSVSPPLLSQTVTSCQVIVDHTSRRRVTVHRHSVTAGWSGLFDPTVLAQLPSTLPEHTLTEMGAVAFAALTVSHFENARVSTVLTIGSGGDYFVEVDWRKKPVQLEVSGLLRDDTPSGADTRSRVAEKCRQVGRGYVAVTAFHHRESGGAYSELCFAPRVKRKKRKVGRR